MSRLEQCHGHFYNWYDTQDLRPLDPRYVSSVDSGKPGCALLTLANACDDMRAEPPDASRILPESATALRWRASRSEGRGQPAGRRDRSLRRRVVERSAKSEPLSASLYALAARRVRSSH